MSSDSLAGIISILHLGLTLVRCSAELTRPENQGLEKAISFLEDLKKRTDEGAKGGPISWADLIHVAGMYMLHILSSTARPSLGQFTHGHKSLEVNLCISAVESMEVGTYHFTWVPSPESQV